MQERCGDRAPKRPHLAPPAAATLRASLRRLRMALHGGRDLAAEVIERSPLPPPMGGFARDVLSGLDRVALRIESVATEVVHDLLGDGGAEVRDLDRRFGAALTRAFGEALERVGGREARLDPETAAQLHAELPEEEDALRAAWLLDRVMANALEPAGRSREARVAAFAALLWLHSDGVRDAAALLACADLAMAVEPEIEAAAGHPERLAQLFAEFRDHV